jgi:hypothetical protein
MNEKIVFIGNGVRWPPAFSFRGEHRRPGECRQGADQNEGGVWSGWIGLQSIAGARRM